MLLKKDRDKILFFRESTFKVARLIFNYPNKTFHIRLLEKETGFSTTAIISSVKELNKYKIIKIEETDLTTNIKADLNSEAYRFYKIIFNLYRLKRYTFIENLVDIFNNPEVIVLFGSFARGEDIEESDVDILVISKNKPRSDLEELNKLFEKELNRKINVHVLNSFGKSSEEFKNAIANGIVLHGYLKLL